VNRAPWQLELIPLEQFDPLALFLAELPFVDLELVLCLDLATRAEYEPRR
jgi:hypothetical protein